MTLGQRPDYAFVNDDTITSYEVISTTPLNSVIYHIARTFKDAIALLIIPHAISGLTREKAEPMPIYRGINKIRVHFNDGKSSLLEIDDALYFYLIEKVDKSKCAEKPKKSFLNAIKKQRESVIKDNPEPWAKSEKTRTCENCQFKLT